MKKFILVNWYKLMIGSSFLMASFGFMVHSITPLNANDTNNFESIKTLKLLAPGEVYVTGCGIDNDYAYLVDFQINGKNHYYKVPLNSFTTSYSSGF